MEACMKTYNEAFDERRVFEMNYRLLRGDGIYRWIFDRGVPFFHDNSVFAGYIGSCIDITERVEAEQSLAAQRAAEIAKLGRLIPICSWCKKVRTDDGYWKAVEAYLTENNGAVTHGICAECEQREYQRYACESVRMVRDQDRKG